MTRYARRAMTCAYMPDGCTFIGTRNILPADYFASLTVGDVLDDERQNALIWHRSWEKAGLARRVDGGPLRRTGRPGDISSSRPRRRL